MMLFGVALQIAHDPVINLGPFAGDPLLLQLLMTADLEQGGGGIGINVASLTNQILKCLGF